MRRDDTDPNLDPDDRPRAAIVADQITLVNHDLRNSLASIVSALHVLQHQGYPSPLAEQAGRTIERQAEHLSRLADQLSEMAGESTDRTAARRRSAAERIAETTPRKVLVVDDNRDAADSTGTLLLLWGHHVRVAYDGAGAVAAAREYRPDVCLLDLGMPGMTGYEVAEALRRDADLAATRLIAMTGFDQEADRKLSAAAGFAAYLVKPVHPADLQAVLEQLRPAGR